MRRRWILGALLLAGPVAAQERAQEDGGETLVTSPAADQLALTVYRARYAEGAINLNAPQGFAMVTETRQVRLPRGRAVLRFEGVADGIVPVSAVVDGLPGGVVEKNRDARLLSPAALVDGTLGRQVTLTRTDKATGRKVSEDATIVAGPGAAGNGGVVLRTAGGIETLGCAGLPERMTYKGVPPGLSAKPVLSVTTNSPTARTANVTLTYLASGFDWRASYVATLREDGATLDLFAWLTLANANPETFGGAQVSAVAGRLNRVATPALRRAVGALQLRCYPLGTTTSDLRSRQFEAADAIVVTGSRMMVPAPMAEMRMAAMAPPPPPPPPPPPEDVGDLKLYRVPEPVTVNPRGQKQVALLARSGVAYERRYRLPVYPGMTMEGSATPIVLEVRNKREAGLGLALPSGTTALYAQRGGSRLLLGQGKMTDRAEGETFRIAAGVSTQVRVAQRLVQADRAGSDKAGGRRAVLRVSNANPFAVTLDVPIGAAGQKIVAEGGVTTQVDGIATWSPVVPANGQAELRYRY